jgi:Flp pilus assembly pilin Flp
MRHLVYIQSLFFRLTKNDAGAVASEYAFLIAFISIIAAAGMVILGPSIADYFSAVGAGAVPNPVDAAGKPLCPFGCPPTP